MVASVVEDEALYLDDVMRILDEASQLRAYSHALEEKSQSLERATAELRQANEQLKSLDRLKDDFMLSVTQELRTPLTSIRALAELMRDDENMDTVQRQQFVGIIVGEAKRLSRLVNQVLDMARHRARPAGHGVREVLPDRWRGALPARRHRSGAADQPPDRGALGWAHVAVVHAGAGSGVRLFVATPQANNNARRHTMSHKILIADDEPNILISLEFLMEREGFEVVLARDGQEAIDAIVRERPALVLLDVMMPVKTGFDVCSEVRASETLRDTRIVMLTAKGRDTDVAKGLALGANAYMIKPFSTKELVQKVRDLLEPAP